MTRPVSGVYRGVSADQRRADRRRQLMDAGLELIGTRGWAQTTVRGVCQEAGLTARFFYESFEDLDALAVAVFDDVVGHATERMLAAVLAAPDEPHAKAEAAIGTFVRELTGDPRRTRVAFVEAMGSAPLMERRMGTMRTYSQLIAAQARAFYGVRQEDDTIGDLAAALLSGGLAELLITWVDGGLAIPREQLIADATELFVATGESAVAISRRRAQAASRPSSVSGGSP